MATHTPASLETLLKSLTLSTSPDPDHALILEHCDKVLSTTKAHPRALHTKLVALLSLDRYDEAWQIFESPDALAVANATLEKAYCLYKLGRLDEAQAAAQTAADSGDRNARGLRHVQAQAAYRMENFPHAAEVYRLLADGMSQVDNEDYDMSVNAAAMDAQLVWSGCAHLVPRGKASRGALDAFETAFNAACISSARGELGQALVLLKRAKDLCNAIEDLTDEEKKTEEAPIVAQEVYVLTRMGRIEDAMSRSAELGVENLTDTALRLIATNNEISAASRLPSYNPHVSLNAAVNAAALADSSSTARPFRFQSSSLERNSAILNLQVGKLGAVKTATAKHAETYPNDHVNGVLRAAAVAGNLSGKEAENKIIKLLHADPKDIGLALTLTQLQIRRNNTTGALQTLSTLSSSLDPSQRYQPGLIGLQVALHHHLGQRQHIKLLLHHASTFWNSAAAPNPAVLRAAGSAHLDSLEPQDLLAAGPLFASLLSANPDDALANCGFVAAYATTDAAHITPSHLEKLTPVDRLIAGIDAAALEALGVAQQPRKRAAEEEPRAKTKGKRVKVKKSKVPPGLVGKTADPERWLPVRDRSSYKPKGKKDKRKAAAALGATQGGAVGEETEVKVEAKKLIVAGGGAGKKKKKKGGKW